MNLTIVHCGPQHECRTFHSYLANRGINLTVIVAKRIEFLADHSLLKDLTAEDTEENGFRLKAIDLISTHNYNLGFHPVALLKALKESQPDIVHVFNEYHCFPVTQVVALRNFFLNKKIPIVIYNFQNVDYLKLKKKKFQDYVKSFIRKLPSVYNLRNIQGATGANREGLDIIKTHHPSIRTERIFWGIHTKMFYKKHESGLRKKLNLPTNAKIIGYFGRMTEEKGVEDVIYTLRKIEDLFLILVGEGSHRSRIFNLAQKLGVAERVIIKSLLAPEDLIDYYNVLDCFVLASRLTPTWKEQYGRVLVEAMACGVPIVASNSGAIPEVLEGYPCHLLFHPQDVTELTLCIQEILNKRSWAADEQFLQKFTWENFTDQHINFYSSLI